LQVGGPFLGLGTLHYRSIEQIDFNDTAECDVIVDKSNKTRATLTTRDPKFLQTNIQEGDIAFFAKSDAMEFLLVTSISSTEPPETIIQVELANPAAIDNRADKNFLVDDINTQVSFVKNPTARTDFFGFGAILYDILTAGASPERFYELLRRFDTRDFSIDGLMLKYDVWKGGLLDDPDIGAIFHRVNGREISEGGLDARVLTFLLKCLMSNAHDSYYRLFGFEEGQLSISENPADEIKSRIAAVAAWRKVHDEIDQLIGDLGALGYDAENRNALTRWPPGEEDRSETDEPSDVWRPLKVLEEYRSGNFPVNRDESANLKPSALRWSMGTAFLNRLFDVISGLEPYAETKLTSLSLTCPPRLPYS